MKKLSKAEAETYASKLNGSKLLDITRKVVNMVGVENTIKIDGWDTLDIDDALVKCSTRQDVAIKEYEQEGYSVVGSRNGQVTMKDKSGNGFSIYSSYDFFKKKIKSIDTHLNVQKGNLTAVSGNRYKHTGTRSNDVTKAFNKYLAETLVQDYPEVCI